MVCSTACLRKVCSTLLNMIRDLEVFRGPPAKRQRVPAPDAGPSRQAEFPVRILCGVRQKRPFRCDVACMLRLDRVGLPGPEHGRPDLLVQRAGTTPAAAWHIGERCLSASGAVVLKAEDVAFVTAQVARVQASLLPPSWSQAAGAEGIALWMHFDAKQVDAIASGAADWLITGADLCKAFLACDA